MGYQDSTQLNEGIYTATTTAAITAAASTATPEKAQQIPIQAQTKHTNTQQTQHKFLISKYVLS